MKRILTIIVGLLFASVALAFQPTKPVTVVIPFSPGGGVDVTFKHLQKYAATQGITMVALYKPGADGLVGMSELSLMPNDGHYLSVTTTGTIAVSKNKSASYELTNITQLRKSIFAFVSSKKANIKTMSELDQKINSLNVGYGAPGQLMVINEYLNLSNAKTTLIPYKGGGPVINDLLGGHIDIAALPLQIVGTHISAGKLNLIATTTKNKIPEFPAESIYTRFPNWQEVDVFCVTAPPSLNKDALEFWSNFLRTYLADKEVIKDFAREQTEPLSFGNTALNRTIKNSMIRLSNM